MELTSRELYIILNAMRTQERACSSKECINEEFCELRAKLQERIRDIITRD